MNGTIIPTPTPTPTPPKLAPSGPPANAVERSAPFGPALARARELGSDPSAERGSGPDSGPTEDGHEGTTVSDTPSEGSSRTAGASGGASADDSPSGAVSGEGSDAPAVEANPSSTAGAATVAPMDTASSNTAPDTAHSSQVLSAEDATGVADTTDGGSEIARETAAPTNGPNVASTATPTEPSDPQPGSPRTIDGSETSTAAPTAGAAAVTDHPTAKGAVGDGGPSTSPTVEGAAPPPRSEPNPAAGTMAASSSSGPLEGAAVEAESALRSSDLRAGPQLSDDATAATRQMSSDPGLRRDGEAKAPASAVDGSTVAAVAVSADGEGALAPGAAARLGLSGPIEAGPPSTASTADGSISGQPNSAVDGAEGLVVLAREAGRAPDGARPTASTPTPGPLNAPEGSLWDDVRMAFDRIRSAGDGQEVRIRLRPAELGELVVQVRTQGDQVAVRLTTSSVAAQQALVDDRLRLAAELARAGFEEGSVDIGPHGEGDLGQSRHGADEERDQRRLVTGSTAALVDRPSVEHRDPIRTDAGLRPGRHAYSTINLTL